MTRVRRCAWEIGVRCHKPATKRVRATYLGQPTDRDVVFCDEDADRAHELIDGHPGWEITSIEPLEQEVLA